MYSDAITYDPQDVSWTYNSRDGIGDPFELIKMYDDIVIRDYFKDLFNARITWKELPMNKLEFMVEPMTLLCLKALLKSQILLVPFRTPIPHWGTGLVFQTFHKLVTSGEPHWSTTGEIRG